MEKLKVKVCLFSKMVLTFKGSCMTIWPTAWKEDIVAKILSMKASSKPIPSMAKAKSNLPNTLSSELILMEKEPSENSDGGKQTKQAKYTASMANSMKINNSHNKEF